MDNSVLQLVDVIKADPAVYHVNAYTGSGNGGFIYIALKPLNERKMTAASIIDRLRPKLNRLPVAQAFCRLRRTFVSAGARVQRYTSTRSRPTTWTT
jgi:multidrug efflux pump subunit AcrB